MQMRISATLILTIFVVGTCATSSGIQEFLVDNGHRHVDIFYNSSQLRGVSLKDLFISRLPMENIGKEHQDSFGIFMFDNSKDDLVSYLRAIKLRQIKMSLLVLSKPWDNEKINLMKKHLSDLQASVLFYIAMPTSNQINYMTWHQIISLKSGSALNHLQFAENSSRIIETFNMHGLEISSKSLSWAPYLTIDDCNEDGLECGKNYGYLIDFMDKLAVEFNFTYVSQKNVDNDWWHVGTHGVYGGVWGAVKSNQYDMSLSVWQWMLSRHDSFDFVPFIQRRTVLAFRPEQSNIDFGLLTRAFAWETWTSVLCTSGALLFAILLANIYGINDTMNGVKSLTLTWWLFFTLVNSYYCGVLTMFFATPASVPFEIMSDAVQAYPNWKLMFLKGDQGYVYEMAERGDLDFISLWKRYQENPTETMFDSIEDGLELIEKGQNVLHISQNLLLGHLKSNPTKQKIRMVSLGNSFAGSLLFHNNSPLLCMFNQGMSYLRETGLERQLFYKWFGDLDKPNGSTASEGNIITLGQMVTVFVTMLVVFVVALFMLCGEFTFKRLSNRLTKHGQTRKEK